MKKVYDFIRYDVFRFIKNIWTYRKALWNCSVGLT